MKFKNVVFLEGRIADDYKYMRTKEGRTFATFTLVVRSFDKDFSDNTERKVDIFIRIMVFDNKLVEYLKKVGAHNGNIVNIMGRLNTYQKEIEDKIYMTLNVVVRDIHVVKTKNEDD